MNLRASKPQTQAILLNIFAVEDLKKAQWYLNHLIEHVEKTTKKENKLS